MRTRTARCPLARAAAVPLTVVDDEDSEDEASAQLSGDHDDAAAPAGGSGEPALGTASGGGTGQQAPAARDRDDDEASAPAQITGQHLRETANRFESGSEGRATTIASTLDETVLAAMRADAEAKESPFIDPALLRKAEVVLAGIDAGWLERVVGHPVPSWRHLDHAEMLLAVRAAETDAEHLGALAEVERTKLAQQRQTAAASAQAKARAAAAQWQRLREQLPVPVAVQHNWTARHLDGYEQGADHIVVLEDLAVGRLRRAAGTPLCQTPSRAHQQRHVSGSVSDERRFPDCKACLHFAKKLAASPDASDVVEPGTDGHASTPPATIRQEPTRSGLPGGHPRSDTSDRGDDGQPGTPPVPDADGDGDDDKVSARAQVTDQQLCQAAHRYLDDGLLPVPAWAARQNGECCCPRGADCDRPGKHPRSVRSGPGPREYSWKPLACRTHAEVDQRFGPGGQYAAGNLMVAIPAGMMAIDRDDDHGGRVALAALNGELGELPPTLSHRTPHGEHLIYRTPENWKGRAWVGKDPANPVPPGIDLRMPGQILMAAPSVVPGPDGPVRYGPVTGDRVAALPAAYVTAWTPPTTQPRPAAHRVPVPPDSADRAAKYVHDAMTRIADDLASRKPGGRNAAAYAAGLKAGSLLGAARATPGAGQAAAAWTDEEAEQALMDAAERNGYTGKDGEAEARRAIRSGLRNGLRSPRALPDFTTSRPAPDRQQQPQHRPAPSGPARPQRNQAAAAPGRRADRWQDIVPGDIRREIEAADTAASDRRRVAIIAHQQALERHGQSATADTAAEVERTRAVAHAAHQEYTYDGRHVTGRHNAAMLRWAAAIAAQREHAAAPPSPGPADSTRAQANQAAVAANEAYREGDLDRARQFTDRAAALDPSRAELWQQHRQQIAARRLILDAKVAHAEGDRQRAQALLGDARQLDPRMPALWDGGLPAWPADRRAPQAGDHDPSMPGPRQTIGATRPAAPAAGRPASSPADGITHGGQETPRPSWPSSPAAAGSSNQRRLRGQAARSCRNSLPAMAHQPNTRRISEPRSATRPNPAATGVPDVPPRPVLTGATTSSARPASHGNPGRAGPAIPPSAVRPRQAPLTPDTSQADDPADPAGPSQAGCSQREPAQPGCRQGALSTDTPRTAHGRVPQRDAPG